MVRLLVELGADIELDERGTALDIAKRKHNPEIEIIDILVRAENRSKKDATLYAMMKTGEMATETAPLSNLYNEIDLHLVKDILDAVYGKFDEDAGYNKRNKSVGRKKLVSKRKKSKSKRNKNKS